MAHPYKGHSENAVGKRRAQKMMSGSEYARGGAVKPPVVQKGGAATGVGRLEKAADAKAKR